MLKLGTQMDTNDGNHRTIQHSPGGVSRSLCRALQMRDATTVPQCMIAGLLESPTRKCEYQVKTLKTAIAEATFELTNAGCSDV